MNNSILQLDEDTKRIVRKVFGDIEISAIQHLHPGVEVRRNGTTISVFVNPFVVNSMGLEELEFTLKVIKKEFIDNQGEQHILH